MIEPEIYSYVGGETAYDTWESLKSTRKVTVLNKLVRMTIVAADNNMKKYVQMMLSNWNEVKATGFKIDEEVIASIILGGLPAEYRPMILGIENSAAELTVDYVKKVLLQEVLEDRMEKGNIETVLACNIKSKKGNKKRKCFTCGSLYHLSFECKQNKKRRKCFNCGRTSHLAKDCRMPKKKQSDDNKGEQPNGEQATRDQNSEKEILQNLRVVQKKEILIANKEKLEGNLVEDVKLKLQVAGKTVACTHKKIN